MSLHRNATRDLLRDVPLFADCTTEEIELVARLGQELTAGEGHYLAHEGHRGGVFTVLLEGTADVLVGDERVRGLRPGDYLGEIATVVGGRRTASVITTSPVRAMTFSDSSFETVLSRSPHLRARIQHTAWERLLPSPRTPDEL